MRSEVEAAGPTFTLKIDSRCKSCVMHRLLIKDLRNWDYMPDNGRVDWAIEEHVERRCGSCIEGCLVEEKDGHYDVFITTNDG